MSQNARGTRNTKKSSRMKKFILFPIILLLVGCQTHAIKVDLIEPITTDTKTINISGRISRPKCVQDKPIPLALYRLISWSSGSITASKWSKQFLIEKDQNSYSIEIVDYDDYHGIAVCPDFAVDKDFSLDKDQCFGFYEKKWLLIFSKKMPSSLNIDLNVNDCTPKLDAPKKAEIMSCG